MKPDIESRVAALDGPGLRSTLDLQGFATTGPLLSPDECAGVRALYAQEEQFRSRVVMARHGFGRGEYQYFSYPLPSLIGALRRSLYPALVLVANDWNERLGLAMRYPESLDEMTARCHAAGQVRPTPLLLKYGPQDYNCLHQDLYGELVFPLQVVVLLSEPGMDFEGGDIVLVEQRPRMQSRPHVVRLRQGEALVLAVHQRPVQGTRGTYRVNMRHGVSTVTRGERFTTGIIFHDAA